MRTDVNAVPHAGLSEKPKKPGGVCAKRAILKPAKASKALETKFRSQAHENSEALAAALDAYCTTKNETAWHLRRFISKQVRHGDQP